ncbi:hypothetical protein TNCV_42441 [Trichonephila clavipes]|nr:hypothetical protein TNCV_42441 [Trichonephila clavipes]
MWTTIRRSTWGHKPRLVGVIRKSSYDKCNDEWNQIVQEEKEPEIRFLPSNVREIDQYYGINLMTWTDVTLDLHTHFERGTPNAVRYRGQLQFATSSENPHRSDSKVAGRVGLLATGTPQLV